MKNIRYIFLALTILGTILSCFALPISDLKSIMPVDMYFEYYWRERVSWIGNSLLFLVIVWQDLNYEKSEYSLLKKILIITILILLDVLVLWI